MGRAAMVSGRKRTKSSQVAAGKHSKPYSTRIIKAGALLGDTKTLLCHWDSTQTTQDNLRRFREENLFGKASRSRVEDKAYREELLEGKYEWSSIGKQLRAKGLVK